MYENTELVSDYEIRVDLQEDFIDLPTPKGRLEARKRLVFLAYLLQKQPKGEFGVLENEFSDLNKIGWFRLSSGELKHAGVRWYPDRYEWFCVSGDYIDAKLRDKNYFFSRNLP